MITGILGARSAGSRMGRVCRRAGSGGSVGVGVDGARVRRWAPASPQGTGHERAGHGADGDQPAGDPGRSRVGGVSPVGPRSASRSATACWRSRCACWCVGNAASTSSRLRMQSSKRTRCTRPGRPGSRRRSCRARWSTSLASRSSASIAGLARMTVPGAVSGSVGHQADDGALEVGHRGALEPRPGRLLQCTGRGSGSGAAAGDGVGPATTMPGRTSTSTVVPARRRRVAQHQRLARPRGDTSVNGAMGWFERSILSSAMLPARAVCSATTRASVASPSVAARSPYRVAGRLPLQRLALARPLRVR